MPVIGLTRVLPQVLRETRDLLAGAWSHEAVPVLSSTRPAAPTEA
jgi:ATP adenylyltransferase